MHSTSDSNSVGREGFQSSSQRSVKLYISGIPISMYEEDIINMLSTYCPIEKVCIIQDGKVNQDKHSAFVIVPSHEDASKLIRELNGNVTYKNMTIPIQITIASKYKVKRRPKDVAESVSEYQSDYETKPSFLRRNLDSSEISYQSSSHCTRNNAPYEDDFPSRGSQLSKPKETNPRESPIHPPPPSLSPTVVSNPFVGSMPVTPSLSSIYPYSTSPSTDSVSAPSYCYSPFSIPSSPFVTFFSYPFVPYPMQPSLQSPLQPSIQPSLPFGSNSSDCHFVSDVFGCHAEGPSGANLFVYHLPMSMTEEGLYALFCKYGVVLSTKVYRDRQTNQSRGFGFVSYATVEASELAISCLNGFHIDGKMLKVQKKKEKIA